MVAVAHGWRDAARGHCATRLTADPPVAMALTPFEIEWTLLWRRVCVCVVVVVVVVAVAAVEEVVVVGIVAHRRPWRPGPLR